MFCQRCGFKAEIGDKFCQRCGASLGAPVESVVLTHKQESHPLAKKTLFDRIRAARNLSVGICASLILGGLVICALGYALIDASTFLHWANMRDSEYVRIYGHIGMTSGQWVVAAVGAFVDIAGIVMAYIGIVAALDKVRPAHRQKSVVAKIVAILLCIGVYFVAVTIRCVLLDPKGRMSIWDYLILCAIWRAIWRGVVGPKVEK